MNSLRKTAHVFLVHYKVGFLYKLEYILAEDSEVAHSYASRLLRERYNGDAYILQVQRVEEVGSW